MKHNRMEEKLRAGVGKGVRYIYTHLPRLLAGSAKTYLTKARGEG